MSFNYLSSLSSLEFIRKLVWVITIGLWSFNITGLIILEILPETTKGLEIHFYCAAISGACIALRKIVSDRFGKIISIIVANTTYITEGLCLVLLLRGAFILLLYFLISFSKEIPLIDKYLALSDKLLGLNWVQYLKWTTDHPKTYKFFFYAYYSVEYQLFLCTIIYFILQKTREYFQFILIGAFCLLITGLIACLMPSEGYISYMQLNPNDFPTLNLDPGHIHLDNYRRLRSGLFREAYFAPFAGPITFPSFHVMLATNFIWAFWQIPYLRWLLLVLNAAIIIGTPVIGAHYFVDCIVGVLLGVAMILLTKQIVQWQENLYTESMATHGRQDQKAR